MASEGNFEVSFQIRGTISFKFETRFIKPLVFFFWEFLPDLFNTGKPDFKLLCDQATKQSLFIYLLFIYFRFHLDYNTKRD